MNDVASRLQIAGLMLILVFGIALLTGLNSAIQHNKNEALNRATFDIQRLTQRLEQQSKLIYGRRTPDPDRSLLMDGYDLYHWRIVIGGGGLALGGVLVIIGWTMSGKKDEE